MIGGDAVSTCCALLIAFALKYDDPLHGLDRNPWLYLGVILASIGVFWALDLYRSVIRYIGPRAILSVVAGANGSALVLYVLGQTIAWRPVPVSVAVIYALIALTWVAGSRFIARWLLLPRPEARETVAIYGAGEAGIRLLRALKSGKELAVGCFVDDKHALQGTVIDGVPVWSPSRLPDLVPNLTLSRLLLAVPSASRHRRAEIIRKVDGFGLRVQTIPDLVAVASGRSKVEELREIDVADLLGRDPVPPRNDLLGACITGKRVMVTGAGGSIGSELCRQIVKLRPLRLVLLEISEHALYEIERELRAAIERESLSAIELVALLGSVHHRERMRDVIDAYGVQTVYHAAAYKHVPIVEQNVLEGLHNNIVGTWYTAEAAAEAGVETFVLVSTDKAVNPTNVMGATKRFAEMVLQALARRGSRTRFCMVRFGNVLESSGSVVPLFREQIRRGGPVTVTHPDIIRYFMTIPEASELVLQASAMGEGGDVFVLDMGSPVRILDLARRMVDLSGLTVRDESNPEGDIGIRITGLRPAEKLFEELLIGKNVTHTDHPRILRAFEPSVTWSEMSRALHTLLGALQNFDLDLARQTVMRMVAEYQPATQIADHVWCRRKVLDADQTATVTVLDLRRPPHHLQDEEAVAVTA